MLYLCPTPIGNLADVTLRVLEVLKEADLVACEDTRHTRVLLNRYGISTRVVSFHDHNEEQRLSLLLPLLREGRTVAVVSDAGMPGLSDPGFTLVRACVVEDLPVTVLPGPSAISTALVLSGLPTDRFAFLGFLARGKAKLAEQLDAFEGTAATLVAFESPRRIRASVTAIGERWPERRLAVCREMSKVHEQVVRGTATQVLEHLPDPVRGEVVLVLERSEGVGIGVSPQGRSGGEVDVLKTSRDALAELLESGVGTKKAAAVVASLSGLSKHAAYELALQITGSKKGPKR
jgi:16S rRNA (cytidine1402-2'-O)-methyltransferase